MSDRINIGRGYINKVANGELTFVGVLNKYFDENGSFESISSPWNEETRAKYINDYERRLIPNINTRIALSQFDEDDFIDALIRIKEQYRYNQERMCHYRYLMWRVYWAGVQNNLYEDRIDWIDARLSGEYEDENSPEELKKRLVVNKRSFSKREEIALLEHFLKMKPDTSEGRQIGLYIMFLYGLRNNEAVALDFKAVKKIGRGSIPCIYIRQSAIQDKREIKASGKTKNANRIIPIFDSTYEFIVQRRAFIENEIKEGRYELPDNCENVGDLPIACNGKKYGEMALPRELTSGGRELFKKLRIGNHAMESTHQTLFLQRLEGVDIGEKDPTTYLLRRNCATRLYCLGFDAAIIEYLIGHDVESSIEARNDFTNDNVLEYIKTIMDKHPYNVYANRKSELVKINEVNSETYFSTEESKERLVLGSDGIENTYMVNIKSNEPFDNVHIKVLSGYAPECRVNKFYRGKTENNKVNIRQSVAKKFI